jgi:hypothetical protein
MTMAADAEQLALDPPEPGRRVDPGPAKQRPVLAALAVDAGHLVTWSVLVDRVWDQAPDADARQVLYTYGSRIRRLLETVNAAAAGAPVELAWRSGGYVLRIDPDGGTCIGSTAWSPQLVRRSVPTSIGSSCWARRWVCGGAPR